MTRTLSRSCLKLLSEYHKVIEVANTKTIPCYVAVSLIGITPSAYLSHLNEMQSDHQDILNELRSTDLSNFLASLQDIEKAVNVQLFKPLFELPDNVDAEIPTVELIFDSGDFSCEVVSNG